jgi:hypothetical protein
MMGIAGADPPLDKALSFVVVGDPPVQRRHRITWRHMFGTTWNKSRRRNPTIYDPSARERKAASRSAVRAAMEEISIAAFPYFDAEEPLMLLVGFAFRRQVRRSSKKCRCEALGILQNEFRNLLQNVLLTVPHCMVPVGRTLAYQGDHYGSLGRKKMLVQSTEVIDGEISNLEIENERPQSRNIWHKNHHTQL